jgi:hypothetical protein
VGTLDRGVSGNELSFDLAQSLFVYDGQTGLLQWRVKRGNRLPGQAVGTPDTHGHLRFKLNGLAYAVHRVCWLLGNGENAKGEVDHWNGERADNRKENLRDADRFLNAENRRRAHKNNRLGKLGVRPVGARFEARITVRKRQVSLGLFDTADQAHGAYLSAKREWHNGCTI